MCNKLNIYILLLSLLFIYSCGGSGGKQQITSMSCFVNNTNWRSAEPNAILTDKSMKIFGTSQNGQTVIININSNVEGDYTLGASNSHYAEYIPNTSQFASRYTTLNNDKANGTVKITAINKEQTTLSGTFSFTAFRNNDNSGKTVSNGNFTNIKYRYFDSNELEKQSMFIYTENNLIRTAQRITGQKNDTSIIIVAECDRNVTWQSINLSLPKDLTAGVNYITLDGPIKVVYQNGFNQYRAINGSLTIIENNSQTNKIKAIFFFNYRDENNQTKSISDGQLEVYYQNLSTIP